MTYEEALEYIHGISWTFCKPGLERTRELCERLGNPQNELKFIHVAGTNGKGSFCSMTSSVLQAAGYKVGLYTSPFIYRFNERMRVNGCDIPDDTLAEITEFAKPHADAMKDKPTEFELITAIAFEYFRRERVDVVVLECGMGGRLDSTNIIRDPYLSVITGISLDHTAFLGDTVEKIAREKAGIIKNRAPVLFGGDDESARAVISGVAADLDSDTYSPDYSALKINGAALDGCDFDYKHLHNVKISLLGLYQPRNAALVIEAISILNKRGLTISEEAVRRGLSEARWRARFEIIGKEPTVIFDGAHNPEGIEAAVRSIKHYFKDKKLVLVSGVLSDKDYNKIADSMAEVISDAYTITPDNPRALSAESFAEVLRERGIRAVASRSIGEALSSGKTRASELETALCCLGSLYTYVEVINEINTN